MKLCFYTVAMGPKYHAYLPLFLAAVTRAYPEAGVIVDCVGEVAHATFTAIEYARTTRHTVHYGACGKWAENPQRILCGRWTQFHPEFLAYEFLFYTDVDLLFARETPDLVERRLEAMGTDCYSNSDTIDTTLPEDRRMTGLHMVRTSEYFGVMRPVMERTRQILATCTMPAGAWSETLGQVNNQKLLRLMLERAGLPMPTRGFFEYHGLHVGHSRVPGRWPRLFSSGQTHRRYAADLMPWLESAATQRLITEPAVRAEVQALADAWHGEGEPEYDVGVLFRNNERLVEPFLLFLRQPGTRPCRIIAIDQASTDATHRLLAEKLAPEDRIVRLSENVGIAQGRNEILRRRVLNRPLLLLDSDVFLLHNNCAGMLLDAVQDGAAAAFGVMQSFWLPGQTQTGFAFVLLSPAWIEQVQRFDSEFELFYDDTLAAEKATAKGLKSVVVDAARACHMWGMTIHRGSERGRCDEVQKRDLDRYLTKREVAHV